MCVCSLACVMCQKAGFSCLCECCYCVWVVNLVLVSAVIFGSSPRLLHQYLSLMVGNESLVFSVQLFFLFLVWRIKTGKQYLQQVTEQLYLLYRQVLVQMQRCPGPWNPRYHLVVGEHGWRGGYPID